MPFDRSVAPLQGPMARRFPGPSCRASEEPGEICAPTMCGHLSFGEERRANRHGTLHRCIRSSSTQGRRTATEDAEEPGLCSMTRWLRVRRSCCATSRFPSPVVHRMSPTSSVPNQASESRTCSEAVPRGQAIRRRRPARPARPRSKTFRRAATGSPSDSRAHLRIKR